MEDCGGGGSGDGERSVRASVVAIVWFLGNWGGGLGWGEALGDVYTGCRDVSGDGSEARRHVIVGLAWV